MEGSWYLGSSVEVLVKWFGPWQQGTRVIQNEMAENLPGEGLGGATEDGCARGCMWQQLCDEAVVVVQRYE